MRISSSTQDDNLNNKETVVDVNTSYRRYSLSSRSNDVDVCPHCDHAINRHGVGGVRTRGSSSSINQSKSSFNSSLLHVSIISVVSRRALVLMLLLLLQSCSQFILKSYETLLSKHIIITFFLTMLVGAGGNAGNQSAVMVIRSLAVGDLSRSKYISTILREMFIGLCLGVVLSIIAFVRVITFYHEASKEEAQAIMYALFVIVLSSTTIGAMLPLGAHIIGIDSAHAGPAIQVVMDIIGVSITCIVFGNAL